MFYHIQFRMLFLLKISIFLWIISFTCISISYGKDATNCQLEITDIPSFQWPYSNDKVILNQDNWLTIEQLSTIESKKVLWIDIRTKSERSTTPLNNAFIIPITELANAAFLKDGIVILVGNAFDQLNLDKNISQLRQQGITNIFALMGGIRAWNNSVNATAKIPTEISPKEFLLGSKTIDWQIISFGLSDEDLKKLPEKVTKSFAVTEQGIQEFIEFITNNKLTNSSFITAVLVSIDKTTTKQLQQRLQPYLSSTQIVWLHGGVENYQNYLKQQQNIIASKGRNLIHPCGLTF